MKRTYTFFCTVLLIPILISCSEILMEKDISNKSLTILAPADNARFFSTGVTFTWERLNDATHYQLQIAKPDFNNTVQILLDTVITSNSFTQQLPIGKYEWRIRANNGSSKTSYISRKLIIENDSDFQSNTVVLLSPSANLVTKEAAQTLKWQPILGSTSYQLQIFDSMNTIIVDETINNISYNYTFSEGSFQWKVRALKDSQQTLYSGRSILTDLTKPNTPVLTSPTNNSTEESSEEIDFSWARTPITGSAEKDSIYIYSNSQLTNLIHKNVAVSPYSISLDDGTYYWVVKSYDSAGNQGNQSNTFMLTAN